MAQGFITINQSAARQLAEKSATSITIKATEKVATVARAIAPGSMKRKIRTIPGPMLGIVVCDHPAASFVLYGTKPHVIKARKAGKFLRFTVNAEEVFVGPSPRRFVNHPGTKANNFLWKALEASKF